MEQPVHQSQPLPGQTRSWTPVPGRNLPVRMRLAAGRWIPALLVALIPLSMAIHGHVKAFAPGMLFLFGLYLYAARPDVRRAWRGAWPVMCVAGLIVACAIANAVGHDLGWSVLDGPGHILLYMAVAATFATRMDTRVAWCGFSLTATACGLFCVVQHFGWHVTRAYSLDGGASTAIEFATLMLGLAAMALVQLLRARLNRLEQCIHVAGLVLGAYGALLTQSRGPLLAFLPTCLLLLLLRIRHGGGRRWLLGGVAVFAIGSAVAMTTQHGAVLQRFASVDQQITAASAGQVNGSLSARVEMWRTATRAFREHPLAGIGRERFRDYMRTEVAAGRTNPAVARYNNPHDMYLGAAAAGGIPGLLALLAVFIVPLVFFARRTTDPDDTTASAAWSGLAIVVLYMLCALTDSVFYRTMTQSFYFFLVLGLAMLIAYRQARADSRET